MSDPQDSGEDTLVPPTDAKTGEWITALAAAGFEYRLSHADNGWAIHVPAAIADAARAEIAVCEALNRDWPPPVRATWSPALPRPESWSPIWVGGFLAAFYLWLGPYRDHQFLLRAAAADDDAIRAGDWWRVITALTVHADVGHLVANIASIGLLGAAVCRLVGSGVAWVAILGAGVAGNALATILFTRHGISVGASTACFGALGLLCGHRIIDLLRATGGTSAGWRRAGVAAGTGFALLSLLGTGPRSDLVAHLTGFSCGLALGLPLTALARLRLPPLCQRTLELLALATIMLAWRRASLAATP